MKKIKVKKVEKLEKDYWICLFDDDVYGPFTLQYINKNNIDIDDCMIIKGKEIEVEYKLEFKN